MNILNNKCPVTHLHSDSHVADAKFDIDDKSSLLIKHRRAHTVTGQLLFKIFLAVGYWEYG